MFRKSLLTPLLCCAFVAGLAFASGCADESGVAAPENTTVAAAGIGLPATNTLATGVKADATQREGLAHARDRWNQPGDAAPGQAVLGFLREASSFLDHDQMVALVQLIAAERPTCTPGHQQRAGGRHGHGPRAGAGFDGQPRILEWADELQLTDEQRAAILAHQAEVQAQMQEIRGGQGGPPTAEQREKMRALQEARRGWVEELLTDEQLARLEELRDARRDQRQAAGEERREQRIGQWLDALDDILDLTDDQRASIEQILADQKEQLDALRDEMRDGEGRPTADEREAHFAAVQAVHEATLGQISAVLTDEQGELFDAILELLPRGAGGPGGRGGPGGPGGHRGHGPGGPRGR